MLREHTTQFIWLAGITLIFLLNYPALTGHDTSLRNLLLAVILGSLLIIYVFFHYLKKNGRFRE